MHYDLGMTFLRTLYDLVVQAEWLWRCYWRFYARTTWTDVGARGNSTRTSTNKRPAEKLVIFECQSWCIGQAPRYAAPI